MKRQARDPNDPEVQKAVPQRFRQRTREDWLKSIEGLSHAPEGVEDPWPPYERDAANGTDLSCAEAAGGPRAVPGNFTRRSPG